MVSKGNGPGQELERKYEGGGEIEKESSRRGRTKVGETEPVTTFSVAEEATIVLAGNNRACSDGESQKNECSGSMRTRSRNGTECEGLS